MSKFKKLNNFDIAFALFKKKYPNIRLSSLEKIISNKDKLNNKDFNIQRYLDMFSYFAEFANVDIKNIVDIYSLQDENGNLINDYYLEFLKVTLQKINFKGNTKELGKKLGMVTLEKNNIGLWKCEELKTMLKIFNEVPHSKLTFKNISLLLSKRGNEGYLSLKNLTRLYEILLFLNHKEKLNFFNILKEHNGNYFNNEDIKFIRNKIVLSKKLKDLIRFIEDKSIKG